MLEILSKETRLLRRRGVRPLLAQSRAHLHKKYYGQKIAAAKERRAKYQYTESPTVSVVVQFFNSKPNIENILAGIRQDSIDELIVIDDGSVDGSARKWINKLDRPNEFLLRCHDIYEVRSYDRAIRMANGDLVCLIQDDDVPPDSDSWVLDAVELFDNDPRLQILGGLGGLEIKPRESENDEIHS